MHELPATLRGMQLAISSRRISPKEAISLQRQKLKRMDARFHSVVQELPDTDTYHGLLAGIGLAHKDIFNTAGRRPGAGHDAGAASEGLVAAPAVARLDAAGASTLATLAMAEYACGATGDNPLFERCINPLNEHAAVGGSSSGSAVAVAGRLVYGSLGTDTAGSVRIPAATCALLGLKTTHGLIPLDGVHPLAPSLDSVGVLTRSAADAMHLLQIVANTGLLRPAKAAQLRIKAWLPANVLNEEVASALEDFARESASAQTITTLAQHQTLTRLAEIVMHSEAAATHREALLACTLSPSVEAVALAGLVIPPQWYHAALADRGRHAQMFVQEHFQGHDLLVMPALPQPVPDWRAVAADSPGFDVRQLLALHSHMGFVNYLGFPSMVFPIARDSRGMPISVQVLARPFHEADLLAFAEQVELRRFGVNGFTEHFLKQG
ncbi:MAG: amidase [Polaromonas sp.]|uniref:amidase n=1 Tax=Polaromonas sp. TaxID=1869339 RepID=UPI0025FA7648|nr:amidase [Polaromonas sp.]MBI2727944.1 amidase [Polaromonas sp.]